MNEAGRKKDWTLLLEKAVRAKEADDGDLSAVHHEARQLATHVGRQALQSFSLLSDADRTEIIKAATARFFRHAVAILANDDVPERFFHHAVRCELVALIERRLAEGPAQGDGAPRSRVLAWLAEAKRRAASLKRLQRRVFCLTLALDCVGPIHADEAQERALPFLIAVALGLRVNSVHQHQARIRKRLFSGHAEAPDRSEIELMDALRYLWTPPFDLACAALAYSDAQRHRSSKRLQEEQEQYARYLRAFKDASERARRAWRALVRALDASQVKPRNVYAMLIDACEELGIDDRICKPKRGEIAGEAKHLSQTWADLLLDDESRRPLGPARGAWKRFLAAHARGSAVEESFAEFERASIEADSARDAMKAAYRSLLDAAHELSDLVNTINNLVDLVGAERSGSARG